MTRSRSIVYALLVLSAPACRSQAGPGSATATLQAGVPEQALSVDPAALSRTFCRIASLAGPSVVTITSRSVEKAVFPDFQSIPSPFGIDPWFGFPGMQEREYVREGLGSGVIIDSRGFIATNNHVVEGADELEVIMADGTRFSATLAGTDPRTDLAVVRIEPGDVPLTALPLGDARDLRVGQIVLAVGSPFALSSSVTQGIISYIGRTGVGLTDYEDFIQTDAAINPGNSGGALVNLDGELVGINTAIASRTGGYDGIGFAIPVDIVEMVTSEIMEQGYVSRGWLGVMIQDVTAGFEDEFGEDSGVIVSEVAPGSPAGDAGLRVGDVIVELDGSPVGSVAGFRNTIAAMDTGDTVRLLVGRDGGRIPIEAEVGEQPGEAPSAQAVEQAAIRTGTGWTLADLDERTAQSLGYDGQGVIVASTDRGGAAERSGLVRGDIIVEVDRTPVSSVDEALRLVSASGGGVLLLVWRGGHTIFIMLELG